MSTSKNPSAPATMFTLFSELPSELRLKIWRNSCYPRVLTLTYSSAISSFTTSTSPPTLLSVTKESRLEALRIYKLSFGTLTSPPRIYFNPYFDTLYLPRHREMGYDETLRDFRDLVFDPEGLLDQVQSVAVDHVNVDVKRPWESYNKAVLLRGFRNLDQVLLILNEDGSGAGDERRIEGINGNVEFVEPKLDPEKLLRIWYCFRQAFMMEEKVLEDVSSDIGRDYIPYTLPTVRLRSKVVQRTSIAREGDVLWITGGSWRA